MVCDSMSHVRIDMRCIAIYTFAIYTFARLGSERSESARRQRMNRHCESLLASDSKLCAASVYQSDARPRLTVSFAPGSGAEQITLEGVFHGPLGGGRDAGMPWYGSPGVLEQWIEVVYDGRELGEEFQVEVGQTLGSEAAVV